MDNLFQEPPQEDIELDKQADPEMIWLPATETQIEIWIACKFGGDDANKVYNLSFSEKLNGNFDQCAMEKALYDLVKRHDSLRTIFNEDGTQMCVNNKVNLKIGYDDISSSNVEEQGLFIERFIQQNAEKTFDLSTGPLFRASIIKLNDTEHYVTITVHHIICDGWSLGIIMEELGVLYSAHAKGEYANLPEAPQFRDYAIEKQEFYKSDEYRNIENYWVDQFKNDPPQLDIPTDFQRPVNRNFASSHIKHNINPDLLNAFIKMGAKAGASAAISLRAAFEILLFRLTGQNDIVTGLPVASQFSMPGIEGLVGHCANLLPLRAKVDGRLTKFLDYLKQRRSAILETYEYQQYTTGTLLGKISLNRDNSRAPLVSVMANINLNQENSISFYNLDHQLISHVIPYDFFELSLYIGGSLKEPVLTLAYNTSLFKAESIKRLARDFEHILKEITHNPETRIADISISNSELSRLQKWNNTYFEYPKQVPLHHLISKTALQFPDKIAVKFLDEQITYQQLNERANQLARLLISQGVKKGDSIAILLDRSLEMVISLLAILKSGGAYIPLDPEYPHDRIEFMLTDSSAKVLLTSKKNENSFQPGITKIIIEDAWKNLANYEADDPLIDVTGDDLAYILYTSGSTGKPKGVMIEHRNLVNLLCSMQQMPGITADDKLLAVTTISFDIAGLELYLPLLTGAELILASTQTSKDGFKLLETIKNEKITIIQATPATYKLMLETGWNEKFSLKILCCGEPMSKDLSEKLLIRCTELFNMYGPTETTIYSTGTQIFSTDEIITIGRPIHNTQVYVLSESQNILPLGSVGEIYIAGDGVARGYLNQPQLSEEKFIPNPFSTIVGSKLYRTGDLGKFLPDGKIQCLGRIDHQMKIRGYRIEPGEIEYALKEERTIRDAIVIAREDRPGEQRLVAYIVKEEDGSENDDETWKASIKKKLPAYMVPNDFIVLKQLPLTANGKVDRSSLPKPASQQHSKLYIAPRTTIETFLVEIWHELFDIRKISINDDFFELGGNSLIAVKLMVAIEKKTGIRLPLTALFENHTIEKLATLIELGKKSVSWDSLVSIKASGSKVPIYLIHGGGLSVLIFNQLVKNLDAEQPVYGLQAKGLNGIDENLDKIEDIATHYIEEILRQNPTGPYALAGYSFGGFIAFEMAKQFKKMGKKVTLLGMFDSYAYESLYHKPLLTRIVLKTYEIIMRIIYALAFMTKEPKIVITNKIRYAKILTMRFVDKVFLKKIRTNSENFKVYSKKAAEMYKKAFRDYKLTPYEDSIVLFRCKKQTAYLPDFKYMGWKPLAKKGVVVHHVPGHHLDLLKSPNVEELAKQLQAALDKASHNNSEDH